MPGLGETMYCAEQINIPPSFPYLLRQYSKAAIRSQPTDLLQWSTAYFRCLSLNIPPPVKPRLEYPIPKEYFGITPGWLKALLYQLSGNRTIHFKVLWDRWTGACLSYSVLTQMLCVGRFQDPKAIPWMRFIGLCAAHLTEDLTSTMKLVCEIVTEEPEGGSAMIPYEIFMDLYTFMAKIDASKPQLLKNVHFGDSLLNLYRKLSDKDMAVEKTSDVFEEEESSKGSESMKSMEIELDREGSKEDISCPSLGKDDHYSVDYYIDQIIEDDQKEGEGIDQIPDYLRHGMQGEDIVLGGEIELFTAEQQLYAVAPEATEEEEVVGDHVSQVIEEPAPVEEKKVEVEEDRPKAAVESVDTITEKPRKIRGFDIDEEENLIEDLERLKELQEIPGEMDEEMEKYKCKLIAEMPLSDSQQLAIQEFKEKEETEEKKEEVVVEEKIEEEPPEEQVKENVEIWVDLIPGIGPVVPDELIKAVDEYMKTVAACQHNMVMPRNIRHYSCPPLEKLEK